MAAQYFYGTRNGMEHSVVTVRDLLENWDNVMALFDDDKGEDASPQLTVDTDDAGMTSVEWAADVLSLPADAADTNSSDDTANTLPPPKNILFAPGTPPRQFDLGRADRREWWPLLPGADSVESADRSAWEDRGVWKTMEGGPEDTYTGAELAPGAERPHPAGMSISSHGGDNPVPPSRCPLSGEDDYWNAFVTEGQHDAAKATLLDDVADEDAAAEDAAVQVLLSGGTSDTADKISSDSAADPAHENLLLKRGAGGDVTSPQPASKADAMSGGIHVTTHFYDMFAPGTPRRQFDPGGGRTKQRKCEPGFGDADKRVSGAGDLSVTGAGDLSVKWTAGEVAGKTFDPGGPDRCERGPEVKDGIAGVTGGGTDVTTPFRELDWKPRAPPNPPASEPPHSPVCAPPDPLATEPPSTKKPSGTVESSSTGEPSGTVDPPSTAESSSTAEPSDTEEPLGPKEPPGTIEPPDTKDAAVKDAAAKDATAEDAAAENAADQAHATGGCTDVTTPLHNLFAPGTPRHQFDPGSRETTRCERGPGAGDEKSAPGRTHNRFDPGMLEGLPLGASDRRNLWAFFWVVPLPS
ncbi:hypothetical protein MMC07_001956 [Pseudocyphellaria aurata]|nr:hypothetical protein [Pseudocyphellaria aurata]